MLHKVDEVGVLDIANLSSVQGNGRRNVCEEGEESEDKE